MGVAELNCSLEGRWEVRDERGMGAHRQTDAKRGREREKEREGSKEEPNYEQQQGELS